MNRIVQSTNRRLESRDPSSEGKVPIISDCFPEACLRNCVTIPSYFLLLISFLDYGFRDYYLINGQIRLYLETLLFGLFEIGLIFLLIGFESS